MPLALHPTVEAAGLAAVELARSLPPGLAVLVAEVRRTSDNREVCDGYVAVEESRWRGLVAGHHPRPHPLGDAYTEASLEVAMVLWAPRAPARHTWAVGRTLPLHP